MTDNSYRCPLCDDVYLSLTGAMSCRCDNHG